MLRKDCKHYDLVQVRYPDTGKTVTYAFCRRYMRRESRMRAKDLCAHDCPSYAPTGLPKTRQTPAPRSECDQCFGRGRIRMGGCSLEHGHMTSCEDFGCLPLTVEKCPRCRGTGGSSDAVRIVKGK